MTQKQTKTVRSFLIWIGVIIALAVPISAAAFSPLLAWRDPIYILAGFAGVLGMALLLLQPLLAGGKLPGLSGTRGRRTHRFVGAALVVAVVIHVAALWITSPPDVIDVLLFVSPTPFALWGAIAMWAVFGAALLAFFRLRLRIRPRVWRVAHTVLAAIIAVASTVHAWLIEGTMEPISKAVLCVLVIVATAKVFADLRVWALRRRSSGHKI
ncbi:MAG: ferric reductase-like transmembrane domain-containing protein [Paracoccaceae bacterium]